ncbi:MAG TPA: hypothetical protein VG734_08915 [Lacunisphaera sp.]|nr:hypothetical protein [Lacunisphaera sp.]
MTPPQSHVFRAWVLVPACALALIAWMARARVERIAFTTGQASWSVDAPAVDPASPTGYAGQVRQQLIPQGIAGSQEWLQQTQQMLRTGDWRMRHVDYDNAPWGRESHLPALYRGWLGLLATLDRGLTGRSPGLAVEHAALYADPLLQALCLLVSAGCTARWFGALPAALLSVGLVALYPLGGQFLPGAPDHRNLGNLCALWSVLPLLASTPSLPRFLVAGIAGGLGLWISPAAQWPIVGGIVLGASLARWLTRDETRPAPPHPWRHWSLGGMTTVLTACLVERYPPGSEIDLASIHPLLGVGCLAAGEFLTALAAGTPPDETRRSLRPRIVALVAGAGLLGLTGLAVHAHVFAADPLSQRLSNFSDGTSAPNLPAWLAQAGAGPAVGATMLPLLLALPAGLLLLRRTSPAPCRSALATGLGPLLVALVLACVQLRWWNLVDSILLAVLACAAAAHVAVKPRFARWCWPALLAVAMVPGLARLLPPRASAELDGMEVRGLINRDLAQWLTQRAGRNDAVVLTSPDLSAALCYHGALRGVGTLAPENQSGVNATIRMASATSFDEALALVTQRQVAYIVIPSWDVSLSQYAQMGSSRPDRVFIARLAQLNLPPWVRPVTYYLPTIPGYEGQEVMVFEVIDEQDEVTALSNLAEFFVETGKIDRAVAAAERLRRYPADPGALSALAQVEYARGNRSSFTAALGQLVPYASREAGLDLAWDRRLSLAVVLIQGQRLDLAGAVIRRCLAEADETRLRGLSASSLVRLLTLKKVSGHSFSDPRLEELARRLLPPTLRQRL